MFPRARLSGLACGLALLLTVPLAAEPFFPEARAAMRAAKTVRIEVEQEFPNPATEMEEEPDPEEGNRSHQPAPPPAPFLDVNLPLEKDAGELFQAMGLRPVADDPADLVLQIKVTGHPVSAFYNMIGTQYAGAQLGGRLTFLLDNREIAETDFDFTFDRPDVVVVTTFSGIPSSGPNPTPESAPFDRALPVFYHTLLEFAGRGLGAEIVARTLQLADPEMKAAACLALGDLAEPGVVPAMLKVCDDPVAPVRAAAAWALGRLKNPDAIPALLASLGQFDEFPVAEQRANEGFNPSLRPPEEAGKSEQDRWTHYLMVDELTPDEIFQRGFDERGFARPYVLWALTDLSRDNAEGVRLLREALKADRSGTPSRPHLRSGAALVLGELKIGEAHSDLVTCLTEGRFEQMAALTALGRLRDPNAVEPILAVMAKEEAKHPKPTPMANPDEEEEGIYISPNHDAARSALQSITGQYFRSVREGRTWWRANRERLLATPVK